MRPKKIFSKISQQHKDIDVEKLKAINPTLWKKLKSQFDIGRKIVQVQLRNGLDKSNENTLRYYLGEYAHRFLDYGPNSFPTSFNVLEPFFTFNHHNSIIELITDEESYGVSLIDFLDFVTEPDFNLDNIDFYSNIPEKVIYNFSFTSGFEEINFSNSNGKTFIVSGLSLIRQENEVALLMQAGESYDKVEAENYFSEKTENNFDYNPFKKSLGMKIEDNVEELKIVHFEGRDDLWSHNVALLFDLKSKSIDLRYIARDENNSFSVISDDFFAMFYREESVTKDDIQNFIENNLKKLDNYNAVFDFAKYCLALPYYVFEKEQRIVDINYETNLNSIIKSPFSKREYTSVPGVYKLFAKPFYFLESDNLTTINDNKLNDESFKIEKSGYWKRLNFDENGFDKNGNKILGKTWVERNDIYYSTPKGITEVKKIDFFEGENSGYIYIMRQAAHEENIFKIGLTKRSTEQRSKELSNTSSVDKFFTINKYHTKDCIEAEKQIHKDLENYRLSSRREFFRCDLKTIMNTCENIITKINNS
ncbi:GIY-YIG nuclease family protein [Flavobacterium sp. C4GT6]|uniref:GIY-YIG nuclease family protein n=1 Tax=Flavobacterium sp. C4GT6 TaxID=3103818 RepID=UPI002ED4E823